MSIDGEKEFNPCDHVAQLHYLGVESSPVLTNNYQDSNIADGNTFNFSQFGKNIINVHFKLHVRDRYEYEQKRQSIYNIFMQKRIFRLRFEENLNFVYFLRPVGFDITPFERAGKDCDIIIPFENPSGYKFSRYDSLNQLDLWDDFPLGWDIPVVDKEDFHFKDEQNFQLINPSGIPIDPYMERHDLKVFVTWKGDSIAIINNDNDSLFTINKENNLDRLITIDGVNAFERDLNINDATNFGYLKLEKGINNISIRNCEKFDIKFEFPFIYV